MLAMHSQTRSPMVAILAALILLSMLPATVARAATNDELSSAHLIGELPFTDMQDTTDATRAPDDPDCHSSGATVWYEFTPAETVDVIANTFGSEYDTTLSVYELHADGMEQIRCNDDSGSLQSQVGWTAYGGVTYFLMVGSFFEGPGGSLVLNVFEGQLPEPEPILIDVDILGATLSRSTGQITVDLSVTCSVEAPMFAEVVLRQRAGRVYVNGNGWDFGFCGPEPTRVSVTADQVSGVFAGGSVQVAAYVSAGFDDSSGWTWAEETVRMGMSR